MRNFGIFVFLNTLLFLKVLAQVALKENIGLTSTTITPSNSTSSGNLETIKSTEKTQIKQINNVNNISNNTTVTETTTTEVSLTREHIFDYQFREYVYCGKDSEVILVITENNKLKRVSMI